jgi:hypothetical protein
VGINRFHWDLRHEKTKQVKLRTKPDEHSHVPMPDKGWRALGEGRRVGVLAAPGTYTVKLTAGEKALTQELVVKKDPNSTPSVDEVTAQVGTLLEIRNDINEVVDMINQIEWVRKQIDDLESMLEDEDDIIEAGKALDEKLKELEGRFFDLRLTGGTARQDTLRWPRWLYAKLTSLAGYIGGSDFPPTMQHLEVYERYKDELAECASGLEEIRANDLAAFNQLLRDRGIPNVISGMQ